MRHGHHRSGASTARIRAATTTRVRRSGCSGCCRRSRSAATTPAGQYGLVEIVVPEGVGSPWHVHPEEDEWFYVLEGELTFWVARHASVPEGRLVRVRPQGRAAHLLRRGRRGEGAGRLRADAVRGIPARSRRARSRARPAAAARRPPGHGAARPDRQAKRVRDPRPPRPASRPLTRRPPRAPAHHTGRARSDTRRRP